MKLKVMANGQFQGGFGPQQGNPFQRGNPFDNQGNTFDGDFERKHEARPTSHQLESDIIDVDVEVKSEKPAPQPKPATDADVIDADVTINSSPDKAGDNPSK